MFDDSWSKFLIVAVVAIVVIGPKEMPAMLRSLGRIVGKLRRHADEFRRQFDESMREAGGEDLKRELDQLRYNNPLNQIRNTIEEAAREVTHPPVSLEAPTSTPQAPATPVAASGETGAVPVAAAAPAVAAVEPAPASAPAATPAQPSPAPENTSAPAQPHVNGAERPL
jgi:sec-independent protein translocase protein TatB